MFKTIYVLRGFFLHHVQELEKIANLLPHIMKGVHTHSLEVIEKSSSMQSPVYNNIKRIPTNKISIE